MKFTGVNELRQMFEDFFVSKDHLARGSYSLVPERDKSLLLVNSGMAPLKPYFSGAETPPAKRMVTCQKCIRTGDIDIVGKTDRHATFFEMLGNFSFGDYFKREAIQWGWEFITEVLGMPEDRLWATIYEEDDEAFDLWREVVDMPAEKIVRLGKEDNFWEIGTGPCGPCSEVYFDRGEALGCGKDDCRPGCDCDRYLEFWNYVFTQFDKQEDGTYVPLAHPNIDTGMGLERLACIMQDVDSIYGIDTIRAILDEVSRLTGVAYEGGQGPSDVSLRIITDHVRAVTFMISDGILPSNEGRGYVLRRLLRRAARHGRLLGLQEAFLAGLASCVVETSRSAYPELATRSEHIAKIILIEEEKFAHTLDQGSDILREYIRENREACSSVLTGEQVFKLYDTFGFPPELTKEMAEEQGCSIDEEGFYERMEQQRAMARDARRADESAGWEEGLALLDSYPKTMFVGEEDYGSQVQVLAILKDGAVIEAASAGDDVTLVFDRSPFYAEGGGQVGDRGRLWTNDIEAEVRDTTAFDDRSLHAVHILRGTIQTDTVLQAEIDVLRRHTVARNHTATHLLHQALKEVLGAHVEQAGSLVAPESLRFDFTHYEALNEQDVTSLEEIINREILLFKDVQKQRMSLEEAQALGAVALFGEKYEEEVRVVSVPGFSKELCGGTHVDNTGQIGSLCIASENSVAAGVRRIEAMTGDAVSSKLRAEQQLVDSLAGALKVGRTNVAERIDAMQEELRQLRRELEETKRTAAVSEVQGLLDSAEVIGDVQLICSAYKDASVDELRLRSDEIKAHAERALILLASESDDRATLIVSLTDRLLEEGYHAGKLIKDIARAAGGGGGGKANMAQAGLKDVNRIPDAFEEARRLLQQKGHAE